MLFGLSLPFKSSIIISYDCSLDLSVKWSVLYAINDYLSIKNCHWTLFCCFFFHIIVMKGHQDYCQPYLKCNLGEGDCDTNQDCNPGLVCIQSEHARSDQKCRGNEYNEDSDCCEIGNNNVDLLRR